MLKRGTGAGRHANWQVESKLRRSPSPFFNGLLDRSPCDDQKKTDVWKRPRAFPHVGLLLIQLTGPCQGTGLLFNESSDSSRISRFWQSKARRPRLSPTRAFYHPQAQQTMSGALMVRFRSSERGRKSENQKTNTSRANFGMCRLSLTIAHAFLFTHLPRRFGNRHTDEEFALPGGAPTANPLPQWFFPNGRAISIRRRSPGRADEA